MDPLFLTLDEVLEIHERQIELYGGSDGIRDPGALESAVATPQSTFGSEFLHPSIPAMAAAYLFHLPESPVSGWQQKDWRKRGDYLPAAERLGAAIRVR